MDLEDNLGMLLTTEEAADRLRVHPSTVRRWRRFDVGPQYLKVGSIYRYPAHDLEDWIIEGLSRNQAWRLTHRPSMFRQRPWTQRAFLTKE